MNIPVSPRFRELHIWIQRNIRVGKKNVTDSITGVTAVALKNSRQVIQLHGICLPLSPKIFSRRLKRGSWCPADPSAS